VEIGNACKIFIGKSKDKRQPGDLGIYIYIYIYIYNQNDTSCFPFIDIYFPISIPNDDLHDWNFLIFSTFSNTFPESISNLKKSH
jgi:hypothetical protein